MKMRVFGKPLNEFFVGAWAYAAVIGGAVLIAGAIRFVVSLLSGLESFAR